LSFLEIRAERRQKSISVEISFATVFAFNTLNAELNPTCHLLALLGAHHIFHIGWLKVKCVLHCSGRTLLKSQKKSYQNK
jgi:hypothetical protein